MIKPATLWALFKTCDDSKWLGDICRALGRQEIALDYGQKQMMNNIMMDSGWLDEAVDAIAEKNRMNYLSRKEKSDGLTTNEKEELDTLRSARNTGRKSNRNKLIQPRSTDSTAENVLNGLSESIGHPSIHPSIHPSNKNLEEHISVQGGAGERTDAEDVYEPKQIDDTGFKYPRKVLLQKCSAIRMSDVLRPNEVEPFVDYLLDKRLCEQEANQSCSVNYVKALAKTWKSEGWNDPDRHTVTYEELQEAVVEINKTRTKKIDLATVNRFWDFLSPDFKHKNGDTVTKYTVGKTLKYWVDIEAENARKREEEAEEERRREERHQKLLLTECDD